MVCPWMPQLLSWAAILALFFLPQVRAEWEGMDGTGREPEVLGKGRRANRTPGYPRSRHPVPLNAPGAAGRRFRASDSLFPAGIRSRGPQVPLQCRGPLPPLLQSLPEAGDPRGGRRVSVRCGRGAECAWTGLHQTVPGSSPGPAAARRPDAPALPGRLAGETRPRGTLVLEPLPKP